MLLLLLFLRRGTRGLSQADNFVRYTWYSTLYKGSCSVSHQVLQQLYYLQQYNRPYAAAAVPTYYISFEIKSSNVGKGHRHCACRLLLLLPCWFARACGIRAVLVCVAKSDVRLLFGTWVYVILSLHAGPHQRNDRYFVLYAQADEYATYLLVVRKVNDDDAPDPSTLPSDLLYAEPVGNMS